MMPDPETYCEACEHRFGNHYFTYGGVGGCNVKAQGVTCGIVGYSVTCRCLGFAVQWEPPASKPYFGEPYEQK